jgi:hypothetical protein
MAFDRRKKKLVNISVQKAIALRIASHSILFAWSVYLVCVALLHLTGSGESEETFAHIRTVCLSAIGVSILVMLPAIIYDAIKFSHRVAGPVMRLNNMLPSVGLEKLEHVGLRKRDYWQEVAAEFNSMLDRVEAVRQAAATAPGHDSTSPKRLDSGSEVGSACAELTSPCA